MKIIWTKKHTGYAVFSVVLVLFLYVALIFNQIYAYSNYTSEKNADCAIILGAGMGLHGPSPVFRERIHHGIALYQSGRVKYLIFTGGFGKGAHVSDAEVAKQYAIEKGVPEQAILLEQKSRYTHENMEYAKVIMEENHLSDALIVSDPLHMCRAMLTAKDAGITAYPSPTQTTKYRSYRTKTGFMLREVACLIGYRFYRIFG